MEIPPSFKIKKDIKCDTFDCTQRQILPVVVSTADEDPQEGKLLFEEATGHLQYADQNQWIGIQNQLSNASPAGPNEATILEGDTLKVLVGGTNIGITETTADITFTASVPLGPDPAPGISLVSVNSTPFDHKLKNLVAGDGVNISNTGTILTFQSQVLDPLVVTPGSASLISQNTGPVTRIKTISVGDGAALTSTGDNVTITSQVADPLVITPGSTSLISQNTGPITRIKTVTGGSGAVVGGTPDNIALTAPLGSATLNPGAISLVVTPQGATNVVKTINTSSTSGIGLVDTGSEVQVSAFTDVALFANTSGHGMEAGKEPRARGQPIVSVGNNTIPSWLTIPDSVLGVPGTLTDISGVGAPPTKPGTSFLKMRPTAANPLIMRNIAADANMRFTYPDGYYGDLHGEHSINIAAGTDTFILGDMNAADPSAIHQIVFWDNLATNPRGEAAAPLLPPNDTLPRSRGMNLNLFNGRDEFNNPFEPYKFRVQFRDGMDFCMGSPTVDKNGAPLLNIPIHPGDRLLGPNKCFRFSRVQTYSNVKTLIPVFHLPRNYYAHFSAAVTAMRIGDPLAGDFDDRPGHIGGRSWGIPAGGAMNRAGNPYIPSLHDGVQDSDDGSGFNAGLGAGLIDSIISIAGATLELIPVVGPCIQAVITIAAGLVSMADAVAAAEIDGATTIKSYGSGKGFASTKMKFGWGGDFSLNKPHFLADVNQTMIYCMEVKGKSNHILDWNVCYEIMYVPFVDNPGVPFDGAT